MHLRLLCDSDDVKQLYVNRQTPHPGDSGFDLFCAEETTIEPGETKLMPLKVKAAAYLNKENLSQSVSYWITPRSSVSKTPLRLANSLGLIDAGYRGPLCAFMDNIKTYPYTVKKGDRLLQIVSQDLSEITFEFVTELDSTQRGTGGIGSTGA